MTFFIAYYHKVSREKTSKKRAKDNWNKSNYQKSRREKSKYFQIAKKFKLIRYFKVFEANRKVRSLNRGVVRPNSLPDSPAWSSYPVFSIIEYDWVT